MHRCKRIVTFVNHFLKEGKCRFSTVVTSTNSGTLEQIIQDVKEKKINKVVAMAGAGISTPSGLPDFRTPGSGIYESVKLFNLPDPTAVFDISFFDLDPKPFFHVAKELYPGSYKPNYVHYFMKSLEVNDLLLRMYTQNIDGLERLAGVSGDKLVEAHGTFATATCRVCRAKYTGDDIKGSIFRDEIPRCRACKAVIKPDIVFFGENLPDNFYNFPQDFAQAQLVLVMGTSLEVYPFAGLVDAPAWHIPRILINRETGGTIKGLARPNDVIIQGDIVDGTKLLCQGMGLHEQVEGLMA